MGQSLARMDLRNYTKTEKVKAVLGCTDALGCTDGVLIYLPLVPMQAFHCAHFTFPP
eukprot:COSAG04_NODE_25_length_37336_cov_18.966941_16_plen_57_part_00